MKTLRDVAKVWMSARYEFAAKLCYPMNLKNLNNLFTLVYFYLDAMRFQKHYIPSKKWFTTYNNEYLGINWEIMVRLQTFFRRM